MTTVAVTKYEMSSDTQWTEVSGYKFTGSGKIFKIKAGPIYPKDFIIGFAGIAETVIEIADFMQDPESYGKPPSPKGVNGIVLTEDGKIFQFDHYAKWIQSASTYAAAGSGRGYAIGALEAGLSTREAVKIACKYDPYSGGKIKTLTF